MVKEIKSRNGSDFIFTGRDSVNLLRLARYMKQSPETTLNRVIARDCRRHGVEWPKGNPLKQIKNGGRDESKR